MKNKMARNTLQKDIIEVGITSLALMFLFIFIPVFSAALLIGAIAIIKWNAWIGVPIVFLGVWALLTTGIIICKRRIENL